MKHCFFFVLKSIPSKKCNGGGLPICSESETIAIVFVNLLSSCVTEPRRGDDNEGVRYCKILPCSLLPSQVEQWKQWQTEDGHGKIFLLAATCFHLTHTFLWEIYSIYLHADIVKRAPTRVAHLCLCRWYLGQWYTAHWSSRPPSAQTSERRNQTPHRQSTDTPASPRPESACSAAWYRPRAPACFTVLLQVAKRFISSMTLVATKSCFCCLSLSFLFGWFLSDQQVQGSKGLCWVKIQNKSRC